MVLNQTISPVTVTPWEIVKGSSTLLGSVDIPPGAVVSVDGFDSNADLYLTASAPVRVLACASYADQNWCGLPEASSATIAVEPSASLVWDWQVGTPPPQGTNTSLPNPGGAFISVSISPSAQPWLTATLTRRSPSSTLTLTPDVSGLSPGTYTGTVTIALVPPASSALHVDPGVIQVELTVSAAPFIAASGSLYFETVIGGPPPGSQPVSVSASPGAIGSAKYQTAVQTDSGGNWLSVTPAAGQTPAALAVSVSPVGLPAGIYTGKIAVQGPANTAIVPAQLVVGLAPSPPQPVDPPAVSFVAEAGAAPPGVAFLFINQGSDYSASVRTQSGGNWLNAAVVTAKEVSVTPNTASLKAGTYLGTVTLTSPSSSALQVPVTLTLLAPPAKLSVSPASLLLTAMPGQTATGWFTVTSQGGPGIASICMDSGPGMTWHGDSVRFCSSGIPAGEPMPATAQVQVSAQFPGTYHGTVSIVSSREWLTVPFALNVTPSSLLPPVPAGIVNTASEMPGAIAPGEAITLYGMGIGPAPTEFMLDASGKVPVNLAGTQVLIDGRTAPVLYASATQVNAIVPYETAISGTATVQVVSSGFQSETWGVPLAPAAPGIFAAGSLGIGQAAALNQDNSPNSAANPAARGQVIQFFGTGEGLTSPQNVTGGVTPSSGNTTTLPVKVTIGGIDAAVSYHGSAPGEAAGVLQVDAMVPSGVTPGAAVPVIITVGGQPSQAGITIAVR